MSDITVGKNALKLFAQTNKNTNNCEDSLSRIYDGEVLDIEALLKREYATKNADIFLAVCDNIDPKTSAKLRKINENLNELEYGSKVEAYEKIKKFEKKS